MAERSTGWIGWGAGMIFLAGAVCGFAGAMATSHRPDTPTGLALKASYMASESVRRPGGLSPVARRAGAIWDERNEDGFEWARQMGLSDPRYCPGDRGPFHAGCVEAAEGRMAVQVR